MAIAITIGEKDYTFELDRTNYRKFVLEDEEYAKIQTKIAGLTKAKKDNLATQAKLKKLNDEQIEEMATNAVADAIYEHDITLLQQINLITQEKVWFASLVKHQPTMTRENALELLELATSEYGGEEVAKLCNDLTKNFTQRVEKPKKQMIRRVV